MICHRPAGHGDLRRRQGLLELARRGWVRWPHGLRGLTKGFSCGYPNCFANPASACQWASQHPQVAGSVLDQARAQAFGAARASASVKSSADRVRRSLDHHCEPSLSVIGTLHDDAHTPAVLIG